MEILQKSIDRYKSEARGSNMPASCDVSSSRMQPILQHLEAVCAQAVKKAFPLVSSVPSLTQGQQADYQTDVALSLTKVLKQPPKATAQAIVAAMPASPLIASVSVSGPGYINICLRDSFLQEQVLRLVTHGVTAPETKRIKVVVDFSSPNIAKEMHVGHLRSTIIGDSICRLLEFLGHDVKRINHLGDWGTQFGMLIAHLQDTFPNYLEEPPQIADLQGFYKESKKRFDEDSSFKARAYQAVVALQSGDGKHTKGWNMICDISKREFNKVYQRLDVVIEPMGESFYQSRMESLVEELKARNLLSLEDGRMVMYAEGAAIPLTVVKSDGGFTYDTSDLTCIKYRVHEMHADWVVYVTDAGQMQHFKSFLACARKAGIYDPEAVRVDHVMFGMVLGEDNKKFKTRSGDTVRLVSLLEEGVGRVDAILQERGRAQELSEEELSLVKDAVAYGCIKYADLSVDRIRNYVFSFDRMLDFRGNTAAYLIYGLTRIRSISRTAGVSAAALQEAAARGALDLSHPKERQLAATLLKLPDVLLRLTEDLQLNQLCKFLYQVSTMFSEFYDNCYCVEKNKAGEITEIHTSRLLLCEATANVFLKCFDILGIKSVDKM